VTVRFLVAKTTLKEMIDDIEKDPSKYNGTFIFNDESERLYIVMKNKLIGITPKHRELLHLQCKSCGAPLSEKSMYGSIIKCEHCGSVYDIDNFNTDVK
jgi:hypothetical protein